MKFQWTFILILILGGISAQDTLIQETLLPIEIMDSRDQEKEVIRLQRNHFLSYPASFDDPSRLLMKFPGFTTLNDQSNFIIFDGMPPHYTKWSLYGAEIVNPNHLSNAGTITDRTSRSAGGVNMLSGQVIGRMDYTNPTSMDHMGDAMAGISDIRFRQSYRDQYFINLGLIGLEAGLEKGGNKTNFLLNYRYSTLGVLSELGVDLGEEAINYQDLTASYSIRDWNQGELNFYGGYGRSTNSHNAITDQELWDEIKDPQEISYENDIAFLGMNYTSHDRSTSITLNYSQKKEFRESKLGLDGLVIFGFEPSLFTLKEQLFSLMASRQIGYLKINQFLNYRMPEINMMGDMNQLMSRTRFRVDIDLTNLVDIEMLADVVYDDYSDKWTVEPGVKVRYQDWEARARLNSMSITPELYYFSGTQKLQRPGSFNFSISYEKPLRIEAFLHLLYDVPFNEDFYSDLNNQEVQPLQFSLEEQAAFIYGLQAQYQLNTSSSSILRLNGSLFENRAEYSGDTSYDNPYAFGHIFNAQWMKTFSFSDNKHLKLSSAFHWRGGERVHSIDYVSSSFRGVTTYDYNPPFAERLTDYTRLDLRLNYIIGTGTSKQVLSLDIQNVMSRQNDAYFYYDPLLGKVILKKQLGIIPILSYRRLW